MYYRTLPNAFYELAGRVTAFEENWYLDGDLYEYFYVVKATLNTYNEQTGSKRMYNAKTLSELCRVLRDLDQRMVHVPMPQGSKTRSAEVRYLFISLLSCLNFPSGLVYGGTTFDPVIESCIREYYESIPQGGTPCEWGWVKHFLLKLGYISSGDRKGV